MQAMAIVIAFLLGIAGIVGVVIGNHRLRTVDSAEPNIPARTIGFIAIIFTLVFALLGTMSLYAVPPDKVALHYSGGPIDGVHYVEQLRPGTSLSFLGLNENVYYYPSTTRNYIVDSNADRGDRGVADTIKTTSSDSIEADWNIAISMKLNTDPKVLRHFHEKLGLKFSAWTQDGWDTMLDQTLRQVLENRMNAEASKYTIQQLYSDPTVRTAIQTAVGTDLRAGVNDFVNGPFFCGPGAGCGELKFLVKGRPSIPEDLKSQFQANRAAELKVVQRQAEVDQATKQAEAAQALKAAIADNPSYVLLKAIESGKITFWVLPQNGSNLTLPTPAP